jgi:tetratricopeptide (TPR) repeat protein
MNHKQLLIVFFLPWLFSCGNKNSREHMFDYTLMDSAAAIWYSKDTARYTEAVRRLDTVIAADSTFGQAIMFRFLLLREMERYNEAIATGNAFLRLQPGATNILLKTGALYETTGDTITARAYYRQAGAHLQEYLDKNSSGSIRYEIEAYNRATCLFLLDSTKEGNKLIADIVKRGIDSQIVSSPLYKGVSRDSLIKLVNQY